MADGFRPWAEAWTDALYGERGFYRRPEGPRGHFETSANAPAGETAVLAAALLRLAERSGCRQVVDVGAGRGELLAAMAELLEPTSDEIALLGLDVVPRPPGLPDRVQWLESAGGAPLPDGLSDLTDALVLAHEWLDVVPCPVLELDEHDELRVVEVDGRGAERLAGPADGADRSWAERWWPTKDAEPGARVEVGHTRDDAWAELVGRVRSGLVVAVDYGHTAATRPPAGSLAAHRSGHLVPPVPDGSCDLTAEVAWDSLAWDRVGAAGQGPRWVSQREALAELGVVGRRPALDPAHPAYDPPYLAELQRAAAAATLLDPGGLGGLGWLVQPVREPS